MNREITKNLTAILVADNEGKLPDEAEREAEAVMMYYKQIKRAELMCALSSDV